MPFRVRIDPVAMRQIEEFAAYLRGYTEDFALEQIEASIASCVAILQRRRSCGATFLSPGHHIAATSFASDGERNIG